MIASIRVWVVLALIGVTCAGAGAIYGPRLARRVVPELYVARAVLPLINELEIESEVFEAINLIGSIVSGSWEQELAFGVNRLEGSQIDMDPSIMAALPMLSLRADTIWDGSRQAYSADVSLRMAVTSVFDAELFLDRNLVAINAPIFFDFPITLNPHSIGSDWNNSFLGGMVLPITLDDDLFYSAYEAALFFERQTAPDFSRFLSSLRDIAGHLSFEYLGREEHDMFSITVPMGHANASTWHLWAALESFDMGEQFLFSENLVVVLHIDGTRLVQAEVQLPDLNDFLRLYFPVGGGRIQFATSNQEGEWLFDNDGRFEHTIRSPQFDLEIAWDFARTSGDNFNFSMDIEGTALSAAGSLNTTDTSAAINFRQLNIQTDDMDASFNIRTTMTASNQAVIFESEGARRLTDLNIFDLAMLYLRIADSPIGGLIGNLLP